MTTFSINPSGRTAFEDMSTLSGVEITPPRADRSDFKLIGLNEGKKEKAAILLVKHKRRIPIGQVDTRDRIFGGAFNNCDRTVQDKPQPQKGKAKSPVFDENQENSSPPVNNSSSTRSSKSKCVTPVLSVDNPRKKEDASVKGNPQREASSTNRSVMDRMRARNLTSNIF